MKFNVLNNEPLQFFDANGVLIGTIEISGSGDMIIRPESGSSRDIILGNRDTVGDVEIGLPSAAAGLKFMGGGTISANGNTLTIGDAASGDSVVIAVPITASNVISSSYALTASHALNAGGSGGGSVPAGTVSGSAQITLLGFVTSSATASFITNSQTSSMSVLTSSFAVTSSHALTAANAGTTVVANPGSSGAGALSTITIGAQSFSVAGGSGGSSIFTAADGFQKTINNLIVSQSNTTSSLTVINSGSTVFDVRGSVGQLFEVQDGLDGVLMSVNDISGIPILTVSSSGDVILAEGSTLQGTAATASFVAGVSAAFPFTGSAGILGSLDITGSGNDIFKVRSESGSLFSVDNGLDGVLMSVNDISGLPLFEVSSSGDVNIVTGNISGSGISTASFGKILVNGTDVSSSLGGGGGTTVIANPGSSGGGALSTIGIAGTNYSVGAGSAAAGTVSSSAQITQLGFVTSSATASFVTSAQTASFMTSSTTGSFNNLIISNLSGSSVPGDGSTISYAVTVVNSGGDKFAIDVGSGVQTTPAFSLLAGNTYRFTQDDGTNAGHPFGFANFSDDSTYTDGVTYNGTAGQAGSYAQIVVTNSTPKLKYRCTIHGVTMGGDAAVTITTGSLIQNGFLEVSGSTRLSGSLDVLTDITASGNISSSGTITMLTASIGGGIFTSASLAAGGAGGSTFPFTGDAQISGSLTVSGSDLNLISGSFRVVSPTRGTMFNIDNNTFTLGPGASAGGGYTAVAIGHNASTGNNYSVSIGSGATTNTNQYSVAIGGVGVSANGLGAVAIGGNTVTAGAYGISMGYQAAGSGNYSINLGRSSRGTGANSVTFNTSGDTIAAPSNTRAFNLYLSDGTGNPDLVISASNASKLSGSSFTIEKSGSTIFEVIGSEGTIFSLDDELDGTLFTVNDRSGIPMFEVSASGRIVAEEGEAVIRSQRPIVTVGTNPFTASLDNAGQYFRVGGNVTCSIFVSASVSCPIGAEFDFFQTSSAGNMLFETGSGVTLNSKNGNLNLAGQFSSATLKYVNNDEWDLMGDLT